MFPHHFFAPTYFAPHYFSPAGASFTTAPASGVGGGYGVGTYGVATYGGGPVASPAPTSTPQGIASARGQRMLGYLWPGMWQSTFVQGMLQAIGSEFDLLQSALDSTLQEAFPATAASWGLALLEAEFGLAQNPSLTVKQRQQRLLAVMQGLGSTTTFTIRALAAAYGVNAHAVEDAPNSILTIICGSNPNVSDLQIVAANLVPARLQVNWIVPGTTYGQLKTAGVTYGYLKQLGLTYGQLKTWPVSVGNILQTGNLALTRAQPAPQPTYAMGAIDVALTGAQQHL